MSHTNGMFSIQDCFYYLTMPVQENEGLSLRAVTDRPRIVRHAAQDHAYNLKGLVQDGYLPQNVRRKRCCGRCLGVRSTGRIRR